LAAGLREVVLSDGMYGREPASWSGSRCSAALFFSEQIEWEPASMVRRNRANNSNGNRKGGARLQK
jgi:hypothetical protein